MTIVHNPQFTLARVDFLCSKWIFEPSPAGGPGVWQDCAVVRLTSPVFAGNPVYAKGGSVIVGIAFGNAIPATGKYSAMPPTGVSIRNNQVPNLVKVEQWGWEWILTGAPTGDPVWVLSFDYNLTSPLFAKAPFNAVEGTVQIAILMPTPSS